MKVCVSRRRDAGFGHRLRVKKNQSTDCDTIVTLYRYRSTNRFVSLLLSGLPVRNVQEAPTIWYHDDRRRAQWLSHKKQSFSVCIGLRTEPMWALIQLPFSPTVPLFISQLFLDFHTIVFGCDPSFLRGHIWKKLHENREIVVRGTVGVWEHKDSFRGFTTYFDKRIGQKWLFRLFLHFTYQSTQNPVFCSRHFPGRKWSLGASNLSRRRGISPDYAKVLERSFLAAAEARASLGEGRRQDSYRHTRAGWSRQCRRRGALAV